MSSTKSAGRSGARTVNVVFEDRRLIDCREISSREDVQQRCLSASTISPAQTMLAVDGREDEMIDAIPRRFSSPHRIVANKD